MTPKYLFPIAVLLVGCSAEEPPPQNLPVETVEFSQVIVEATGGNPAAEAAANEITDPYMREIIAEISSDAYEGRGPGSKGDEMTRKYLAQRMEAIGLQPAGDDGGWDQAFELVGINAQQPEKWTL